MASSVSIHNGILPSILDAIGQTPLVRLNRVPQMLGLQCEVLVKCEFMNPGGSVKDRIAYGMIRKAEEDGILHPGNTILEATSGNTGIGFALCGAALGYRVVVTMPEKMSFEKESTMRALQAKVVRTPNNLAHDDPSSHIGVAKQLERDHPTTHHLLDQYGNAANPDTHYRTTGEEIWKQCSGKVDMLVAGIGTGGTITGVGRRLKEGNPHVRIVGVDPHGSILSDISRDKKQRHAKAKPYLLEGIGYDFIPDVLNCSAVTDWVKVGDEESFKCARMLHKYEGLLVGGSSGAALAGLAKIGKDLDASQRVVVVLPDSSRNYMSNFLSPKWLHDHQLDSLVDI